jgi:hypothetical protein
VGEEISHQRNAMEILNHGILNQRAITMLRPRSEKTPDIKEHKGNRDKSVSRICNLRHWACA